jgi:hypothetical protein
MAGHYYTVTDYDLALAERIWAGLPPIGPLTEATQSAFDACQAQQHDPREHECGCTISTGGHDPYSTSCDLDANHTGPHEGPGWFSYEERLRWTGGGSCAGDALPFELVV